MGTLQQSVWSTVGRNDTLCVEIGCSFHVHCEREKIHWAEKIMRFVDFSLSLFLVVSV